MKLRIKPLHHVLADLFAWTLKSDMQHNTWNRCQLVEPFRWKDGRLVHVAVSEMILSPSICSSRMIDRYMRKAICMRRKTDNYGYVIGFEVSRSFLEAFNADWHRQQLKEYYKWKTRIEDLKEEPPKKMPTDNITSWCGYPLNVIEEMDIMRVKVYWCPDQPMDPADWFRYMQDDENTRYGYPKNYGRVKKDGDNRG